MAWKRRYGNFRRRVSGYAGRARSYGRRNRGGIGVGAGFVAGVAVGLTDYDKMIPYEVKIAVACLPSGLVSKVPQGRAIQTLVQGMLIGDIIQARTGFSLGGAVGGSSAGTGTGTF